MSCLQGRDPVFEDLIHLGEALLDQPVQAAQPIAGILHLARERSNAPIDGDLLIGPPPGKGDKHR